MKAPTKEDPPNVIQRPNCFDFGLVRLCNLPKQISIAYVRHSVKPVIMRAIHSSVSLYDDEEYNDAGEMEELE